MHKYTQPLLFCLCVSYSISPCISGMKTGTGTVIIQVEDANDHVPELPTKELVVCEKEGELSSVLVAAEDKDQSPFASPFSFELADEEDGKWAVKRFNGR